jgi:hypothetical protein
MIDIDGITFMPGFQFALTTEGGGAGRWRSTTARSTPERERRNRTPP